MYRPSNPRFNASLGDNKGQHYGLQPNKRTHAPNVLSKNASKSSQSQANRTSAIKPFGPEINKWKSSFAEIEDKDNNSSNDKTNSPGRKRFLLYDPYGPVKSDSDDHSPLEEPHDNSKSHGCWDTNASQKQQLSPEPPPFPIQQTDPAETVIHSSGGGTTDHKDADYRPEVTMVKDPSTVLLSPPPPLHNYKLSSGYSSNGPDQVPPPRSAGNADWGRMEMASPKNLITCDLCEVEVSNGQELEEHMDSKTHWDTLEYIQKHNNYDDLVIAFLQDVMLYKCRKSSRAIKDTALQALQEYDHMTKVEMFHCAACNAFVPTSALTVQNHITTQEHMTNTKKFEAMQRRMCLDKASTMMKELIPQFMTFAKGTSPFK